MDEPGPDSSEPDGNEETHVVTAFLRNRGEVLLLRRSDAVGSYAGRWGGVSGFAEGDPDEQVRVEIEEETGVEARGDSRDVEFVRSSRPVRASDPDLEREWIVHPYLFDCDSREVALSEEHDALEWAPPPAMLTESDTVPKLWEAYERVAPTVRSIAADDDHGAAYLSVRALETLRDRAGLLAAEREAPPAPRNDERRCRERDGDPEAEWDELAALAKRLLEARPSMAVLRNRVNRAMAAADGEGGAGDAPDAGAVLESATSGIERALEADEAAAREAAERLSGPAMTLSRSGTVLEALREGDLDRLYVAESRPEREGVGVAEALADDVPVTLHTDAAAAHLLAREAVDRVVVGADTVLPDGRVVNKTGSRGLAVAAAREGVPVSVVTATDKVSSRAEYSLESGSRVAVYDGDAAVDVANPTFDVTPADCVSELLTERGALEPAAVERVADELRDLEGWRES
ncbi:NUDIX domain-containing protein [Natrononativus amylolyticus]|uniref:NUDIX domain-containing protein n=1 Tax=Natrononativus amylolyticus TaxID=2963434 RepID=UPI0020CEF984|nr:NUDIX domain-containing protein [Natrononativus amylolyticus]